MRSKGEDSVFDSFGDENGSIVVRLLLIIYLINFSFFAICFFGIWYLFFGNCYLFEIK